MKIEEILIRPIISEKALKETKKAVYLFAVNKKATKQQIKSAVEKLFSVEVATVTTVIRKGKVRRLGRRMREKRKPDIKLAYIKLKKGKIDLFPQT
jgi:large subunit ribosomal protein L23